MVVCDKVNHKRRAYNYEAKWVKEDPSVTAVNFLAYGKQKYGGQGDEEEFRITGITVPV